MGPPLVWKMVDKMGDCGSITGYEQSSGKEQITVDERVITTMWCFMHERWKERREASGRDQHNVRREELLSEIRKLSKEEGHMPLRYRFLFKPGLERLEKLTLIRMQYWVEKSGGIIKQWRMKEKVWGKRTRAKGDTRSYLGNAAGTRAVVLRGNGRRRRVCAGSVQRREKMRKERRR